MNKTQVYEYLHIPLWLLKDTFWAMDFKIAGTIMIIPTLLLGIKIIIKTKNEIFELLPNIAIVSWILANSIWMTDELFFILGLVLSAYWIIKFRTKLFSENEN